MGRLLLLLSLPALAVLLVACDQGGGTTTPPPETPASPPSAPPTGVCPPSRELAPLGTEAPDFAELDVIIRDFLTGGGDPSALRMSLKRWGMVGAQGGTVDATADLTGDGVGEVVVVAADAARATVTGAPGVVLVFSCRDGAYELLHRSDAAGNNGLDVPELRALEDLTGDGRAELLYTLTACGAHTCGLTVRVLGYDPASGTLGSLLAAPIEFVPYGELRVVDAEGGRTLELVVDVGMIGSVGAGPQREYRETYRWDGTALTLEERVVATPRAQWSAIHFVADADAAAREGRYDDALALYEDLVLVPPVQSPEDRETLAALQLYARYRIVVTHALASRKVDAAAAAAVFAGRPDGRMARASSRSAVPSGRRTRRPGTWARPAPPSSRTPRHTRRATSS